MTLVTGDLRAVAEAIELARQTLRTIKSNLFWAFAYNVAARRWCWPWRAHSTNDRRSGRGVVEHLVVSNSVQLRRFSQSRA